MAWGQSIASGIGRAGNEFGTAVDYNLSTALQVIQQRLVAQQIQQQIRESEERMKRANVPSPQGIIQLPQGTFGASFDPNTGQYKGQQIPNIPATQVPSGLSDQSINDWGTTLHPGVRDSAIRAVRILRDLGDYEKAAALMGTQAKGTQKLKEVLKPDPQSSTGWSKIVYDAETGQEVSRQLDVAPQRGLIERESTTTDPFGLTSTTVSKPIIRGQGGAPPSQSRPSISPTVTPTARATPSVRGKAPLDADGHIPIEKSSRLNPFVVEGANQLLDGMAIKDLQIPEKAKPAAAALARQHGWEQGKFTPKEQVMLREATSILQQTYSSPSLKVLDEDWLQRQKLAQVISNPDKMGMFARGLTNAAAMNLTNSQAEFLRLYNQMVGRISGLSQLVRSGRATEAQIERLKAEIPNPLTTRDSSDARKRLKLILNEVEIAMQKGTFEGVEEQPQTQGLSPAAQEYMKKLGGNGAQKP